MEMNMATATAASYYGFLTAHNHHPSFPWQIECRKTRILAPRTARASLKTIAAACKKCGGKGAIECPGCKGTGRNKKNGNMFERWKCFDCQGFGMKSCPSCGKGGLTPEQRGER